MRLQAVAGLCRVFGFVTCLDLKMLSLSMMTLLKQLSEIIQGVASRMIPSRLSLRKSSSFFSEVFSIVYTMISME